MDARAEVKKQGYYAADYGQGIAIYHLPGRSNGAPEMRGKCVGWSDSVFSRHKRFLMMADVPRMAKQPFTFSLTFGRHCKITPDIMAKTRHHFLTEIHRAGLGVKASHTKMEFQRDGTAHLHGSAFGIPAGLTFQEWREDNYDGIIKWAYKQTGNYKDYAGNFHCYHPGVKHGDKEVRRYLRKQFSNYIIKSGHPAGEIIKIWLSLPAVKRSRAKVIGQFVFPLYIGDDGRGWFIYCGKHAARSQKNYQMETPTDWQNTPRMWTRWGEWKQYNDGVIVRRSISYPQFKAIKMVLDCKFVQRQNETDAEFAFRKEFYGTTQWTPPDVKARIIEIITAHDIISV